MGSLCTKQSTVVAIEKNNSNAKPPSQPEVTEKPPSVKNAQQPDTKEATSPGVQQVQPAKQEIEDTEHLTDICETVRGENFAAILRWLADLPLQHDEELDPVELAKNVLDGDTAPQTSGLSQPLPSGSTA